MTESRRHTHNDDPADRLSELLDDVLTGSEREQAQQLVDSCPACRVELAELRTMQGWLHDLPPVSPPRSFTLDPAQYRTAGSKRWFGLLGWGGALAIVLLFVGLGVAALRSSSGSTSTAMRVPGTGSNGGAETASQPMAAAGVTTGAADQAQQPAAASGGAAVSTAATGAATAAAGAEAFSAQTSPPPPVDVAPTTMAAAPPPQTSGASANSARRLLPLAITPTGEQLPTAPPLTRMTEAPVFSAKGPAPASTANRPGRGWLYGGLLVLVVLAALAIVMNRRRS